jgi:hypothetical protein
MLSSDDAKNATSSRSVSVEGAGVSLHVDEES